MRRSLVALWIVALFSIGVRAEAAGITWQGSLDAALADAKVKKGPVFIAVNMDGERANDEMVAVHYKDPRIATLAAKCASLFASVDDHSGDKSCKRCGGPVTCVEHRAVEKVVRAKYLKSLAGGGYVAPEHVFLDGDGKILLSVPYRITLGELEWCFVAAIKAVDPSFEWKLSDEARPPRRLVNGGVAEAEGEGTQKAPTKKEVDEILAELAKSKKFFDKLDLVFRLLRSNDKRAIDFFEGLLANRLPNREDGLLELLRAIGRVSPTEYAPLIVPFLEDDRPAVKSQSIVTLELLANPKALSPLTKAWKAEKEIVFKKDLIRAIASCGAKDSAAQKLVLSEIATNKEPLLRASAMLGAEHLLDKKGVSAAIDASLTQPQVAELRFAAGYVVAALRDPSKRATLEAAAGSETDAAVKPALAACLAALDGKPLASLDVYLRSLCQSDLPRDRQ